MSTPRGRRPGGPDTRGQILEAARESFAQRGFGSTTIRAVASAAGVDPALVHHYFGSKDDLFIAALKIPADPRSIVPTVFSEGVGGAGERLLRVFLGVWEDPAARLPLIALVRTSLGEGGPVNLLREGMLRMVFGPLTSVLPPGEAEPRAQLVASQLIGLVVGRYLLRLEPLASMTPEELVAWVAPTLQRYLDGPLPLPEA
ncbi:MAG: TetR family transcriptional regulator [Nocardioides sp.]